MTEILKPKELWERGISLQNAWDDLASDEQKSELANLSQPASIPETDPDRPIISLLTGLAANAQASQRDRQAITQLIEDFRYELICDLFNEDFYGFGYPAAPSKARMPRRIDPAFWDSCEIRWDKGWATTAQFTFDRIRIVDPQKYPMMDLSPKKPGPKSQIDKINWAIAHHTETQPDFWEKTDRIRIQRMRKSILEKFGIDTNKVKNFSDKTFENYLLKYKKTNF